MLDAEGKQQVLTMGSYGIGVSRAVAVVAEQSHDEMGLCWPREIAPADIHIVATGKDDVPFAKAEEIAEALESIGARIMLDDRRDASPGVKFKDAELIGIPTIVVVGKGLAEGTIEVRDRKSGERSDIPVDEVVGYLAALLD